MAWSTAARAAAAAARKKGGGGYVRRTMSEMVFDRGKTKVTPRSQVAKMLRAHRKNTTGSLRKNWMEGLLVDVSRNGQATIAKPALKAAAPKHPKIATRKRK